MSAPVWITAKGNLGTIQEQEFYELIMETRVPDDPNPDVSYKIISGQLPPGLVMYENGTLQGYPKEIYKLRGVPFNVSQDTTSTFCCRATNTKTGQITDRTFNITVTGQDAPEIITESQQLGMVFDGNYFEYQIQAIDLDQEPIYFSVTRGRLPSGLELDPNTGIISGFVEPTEILGLGSQLGWSSESTWDQDPWDFGSRSVSKRFDFDISVTDYKETVTKTYGIFVISKDSLTADNESIIIDPLFETVTADLDIKRNPILITPSGDIGTYAHDNYFAYQFEARDFDGDALEFSLLIGENIGFDNEINGFDSTLLDFGDFELPPGLILSTEKGWLYGYLPALPAAQLEYKFGVKVYKRDYPSYQSKLKYFTITIVGDLRYVITWNSPSDLGTIKTGTVSELEISASNTLNKVLNYSLRTGKQGGRLPQGLRLLENGLIVGRTSFEITTFDSGKLTFDQNNIEDLNETSFDRRYTFTIRISDSDNSIVAFKTFTLLLVPSGYAPYESLYLRALPGPEDKEIYNQVVYNTDIIPDQFVYRNGDPYFGKQRTLSMLLLAGITPSTATEYRQAMSINHYRKKLLLGSPTTARALDKDGNVKYEVLYLPLIDDLATQEKSLDLRKKINRNIRVDTNSTTIDSQFINLDSGDRIIYPNGLISMRKQIRDSLGFVDREILPDWMNSKQENGRIPYWNPALILCYLKPGTSKQVKFYLDRLFEFDLKQISFDVDRYIWDCNMSKNYDAINNRYTDSFLTTFDANVRQGADLLVYNFICDGSTSEFDMTIDIEEGIIEVILESYIDSENGPVLDRSLLNESTDYIRSDTKIILTNSPSESSILVVNFRNFKELKVDYAVDTRFNNIDGMTSDYIDDIVGGLDGLIDVYPGKTIIFARQEQYPGYIGPNDGWIKNKLLWDSNDPWDDLNLGFDEYEIIPGFAEAFADGSTLNQRAGIWKIIRDSYGFLRLEFQEPIALGQRVLINYGQRFGGTILKYGPRIRFEIGETVPKFEVVGQKEFGNETIFDGGNTRFVEGISIYEDPDVGDKYLVFPRNNIFA